MHCQLETALGIISTTIGRLFPTEILSLALGRPSFGIASGDVLTELNCFRVVGRVLPSLALDDGKKYSLLPLVEFVHPQVGTPGTGQLVSPNFILQGKPTYYENYHPGRSLIFRINSRYVLFENYIATHFDLPISQLHVPLTVIKENFTAKDFSIIHEQFAESQNGLTDLHSLLSVISQTAVDRDEVKNAISMMISTEDESANMSEVATDLQTFAHRTLLLALSEITSPIVTFLFTVIQVLSFIRTIVLTVKFLKNDAPQIFRSAKHSSLTLLTKLRAKRPSASAYITDNQDSPLNSSSRRDTFGSTYSI